MLPGAGKRKGSQFERDVCKDLSLWVSDGKQEDVYWRSALSGGRTTVARAKGKALNAQAGDISCIHPCGHVFASKFLIECKFYADLDFLGILTGKGKLVQFWHEAWVEAGKCYKQPLLVAKQNRVFPIACLSPTGSQILTLNGRAMIVPKLEMCIIPWSDFLHYAERPK